MDHDSMTQFSATFSHSLFSTPNSTSCCYQPNFSPSMKPNITYRPHQFSLTSLLYIFFFQFSSPYKSSYRARRDKVVRSQRINNVPVITPTTSEAFSRLHHMHSSDMQLLARPQINKYFVNTQVNPPEQYRRFTKSLHVSVTLCTIQKFLIFHSIN